MQPNAPIHAEFPFDSEAGIPVSVYAIIRRSCAAIEAGQEAATRDADSTRDSSVAAQAIDGASGRASSAGR
jgi:hypothetical protein